MNKILRVEIQGNKKTTLYSKDGVNICHSVEEYIPETQEVFEQELNMNDIQAQTLLNTEYLVAISQLNNM